MGGVQMSWWWCSRLLPSGQRIVRCWRPPRYRGGPGAELCEEHAIALVRGHGLRVLTREDRARFRADHPDWRRLASSRGTPTHPVGTPERSAPSRIKVYLPDQSPALPLRLPHGEAVRLVAGFLREGRPVVVRQTGEAPPAVLRPGESLPFDATDVVVLPSASVPAARRTQVHEEAARLRKRAREAQDRARRLTLTTRRLMAALARNLQVSLRVLGQRDLQVLAVGPEDALRLLDRHLATGGLAVARAPEGLRPLSVVPDLPPDTSEVWIVSMAGAR
jgi:hypothetical protein